MFKKLVANLPFNPSLIGQVTFYTARLKQEQAVRRLSVLAIAFTMVLQIFAVVAPPVNSLEASSNHIINGVKTRTDILNAWDNGDVAAIYGVFGVTRADIEALPMKPNVNRLFSGDGNDYWTTGRNSLTAYSRVGPLYKYNQISFQYAGKNTATTSDDKFVYHRQLRAWDINNPRGNYYQAFQGKLRKTGETFWILVDCGNFTKIGKYTPPEKPQLDIRKTIIDRPTSIKPGDRFSYLLEYRNTKDGTTASDVSITDQLDTRNVEVVSLSDSRATVSSTGFLELKIGGLEHSTTYKSLRITLRVKQQVSSGTSICNVARITASDVAADESEKVCLGVINPCPYDRNVPDKNDPSCVEPTVVCQLVDAAVNRTTRTVTFRTVVTSSNPENTTIKRYDYDFGDGEKASFNHARLTHEARHTYALGEYTANVVVYYKTTGQREANDKNISCSGAITFEDKPVGQSKKVTNITQDKTGDNAETSKVKPGDVLEYTLVTSNSDNYERTGVDISDYIGDILDYAVLDEAFLKEQKGSFDKKTDRVVWEKIAIPASSEIEHSFRVKIKDPIPATNRPSNVGTAFDCKISNEYGNEITINVDCPMVKGIETLPNTGPGASLVAMTCITTVVGYFFARSRLLAKELSIVRNDYVSSGGM